MTREVGVLTVSQEAESVVTVPRLTWACVSDTRMEGAIIHAMSDEISRMILNSTAAKGGSVEEITHEIGFPLSTVYRRIHELEEAGLLLLEEIVLPGNGRRYSLYRSAFNRITMALDPGGLRIWVTLNENVAYKFHMKWQSIRPPGRG